MLYTHRIEKKHLSQQQASTKTNKAGRKGKSAPPKPRRRRMPAGKKARPSKKKKSIAIEEEEEAEAEEEAEDEEEVVVEVEEEEVVMSDEEEEGKGEEDDKRSSADDDDDDDDDEEEEEEGVICPYYVGMKLRVGDVCVVNLEDGGIMVCKVVKLLPVVWVEGSVAVGDVEVHEFGGNGKKKEGPYEPLYVSTKKRKAWDASATPYNLVGKNGNPPANQKCDPVHITIWSESMLVWDRETKILTGARKLKASALTGL
jgi:hypothetical protein